MTLNVVNFIWIFEKSDFEKFYFIKFDDIVPKQIDIK